MFGHRILKKVILVSLIVVFAVITMSVIDKSSHKLAIAYYTLTNKPNRSDSQFNIPTGRITQKTDGTKGIDFEVVKDYEDAETEVTGDGATGAQGEDERQGTSTSSPNPSASPSPSTNP